MRESEYQQVIQEYVQGTLRSVFGDERETSGPVDIIERIDAVLGCQHCGGPLDGSPSGDFCGEPCQQAWHTARTEPLRTPTNVPLGWIEFPEAHGNVPRTTLRLRELPPVTIEIPKVPDPVLRALCGLPPLIAQSPAVREILIPVRRFTTDLGIVYEAVAEIRTLHGAPRVLGLRHTTTREITPTARLITTPTDLCLELRDAQTGNLLARDVVFTPEPPRPMTH